MAALKSKAELLTWYNELKTKLNSKEINTISFEQEIVKNINWLIVGDKKPTTTKLSLAADILLSVQHDHIFTLSAFSEITQFTINPLCANNGHIQNAVQSFISVQTQRRRALEKEQAVREETKKTFAKFPTKAEIQQWVSSRIPTPRSGYEAISNIAQKHGRQEDINFYNEFEKQLVALKLELDRVDPNYIDNILLIDYFVSLIATREIPPQSYLHLVDELASLHADPVRTPNIDALVERGTSGVTVKAPTAAEKAVERATAWREDEAKQNHHYDGLLQRFAQSYCPVAAAKQLARQGLCDFVRDTVQRVLVAIANPVEVSNAELLSKGHHVAMLQTKHGVIATSTTIANNGVVKMRIFAERATGAQTYHQPRGLTMPGDPRENTLVLTPMSVLIDDFIHMWDIPNQRPRHDQQPGFTNGNYYGPSIEEQMLAMVAQEANKYRVTATYGTTEDSIIIVLS